MSITGLVPADDLLERRRKLAASLGIEESEARARRERFELTTEQVDALDEIDEIDFLLAR